MSSPSLNPPNFPSNPEIQVDSPSIPSGRAGAERGVTPRAIVASLLFAALFGAFIPVIDYRFFNTFLGATHLPPGAIGALLVLLLVVNPLLRLISRRLSFSRNEVLTVYLSCLFSTLVPGVGGNNYFVSYLIGSFYFATRENKWLDFLKGLPPWFTPALNADGSYNKDIVDAWYNGLSHGQSIPWGAWIVPLVAWGAFMLAAFGMMACLSVMLRAQWGENEALSFPLLRLPLELTQGMDSPNPKGGALSSVGDFFRNRLMWCGFGVAAFIQLFNGLNGYFPEVPPVPLSLPAAQLFTEAPWNQIGAVNLQIFPHCGGHQLSAHQRDLLFLLVLLLVFEVATRAGLLLWLYARDDALYGRVV